jgi:hypothetical protein
MARANDRAAIRFAAVSALSALLTFLAARP